MKNKLKIDTQVLERAIMICHELITVEMITQDLRERVKVILKGVLWNYNINRIFCDETNNPCNVIDSGRIKVLIEENTEIPDTKVLHEIIL